MPQPELADDADRLLRAVRPRRVPGELLVSQVGVVLEVARRLDEVDALAPLAGRQLGPQMAASRVAAK